MSLSTPSLEEACAQLMRAIGTLQDAQTTLVDGAATLTAHLTEAEPHKAALNAAVGNHNTNKAAHGGMVDPNAGTLYSPVGARPSVIAANVNWAVPAYVVGTGRLQVFINGHLCTAGTNAATAHYKEIGATNAKSTVIQWHKPVPTDTDIFVRVA